MDNESALRLMPLTKGEQIYRGWNSLCMTDITRRNDAAKISPGSCQCNISGRLPPSPECVNCIEVIPSKNIANPINSDGLKPWNYYFCAIHQCNSQYYGKSVRIQKSEKIQTMGENGRHLHPHR